MDTSPGSVEAESSTTVGPARVIETYSAGLKLALVARGEADVYANTYEAFYDWDICAGHVLVTEAGGHVVMNVSLSRGCPGEPDDPRCRTDLVRARNVADKSDPATAALGHLTRVTPSGVKTAAQIALYPLGRADYMDQIAACIGFAKKAGVFANGKHFCTKLAGDAADVFQAIEQSFLGFGAPEDHVVLTAVGSKGSPSAA